MRKPHAARWPNKCVESWGKTFRRWHEADLPFRDISGGVVRMVAHTLTVSLHYIEALEDQLTDEQLEVAAKIAHDKAPVP